MNEKEVFLKRARDGFAHWRATRKGKEPIPKELFQLAAGAVEFSDVPTVAFELGLNTGRLARGLDEVRQLVLATVPKVQAVTATREGLHFSRLESSAAKPPSAPPEATVPKQNLESVHAQVHFSNGIVLSLITLASVRAWCREAAQAACYGGE